LFRSNEEDMCAAAYTIRVLIARRKSWKQFQNSHNFASRQDWFGGWRVQDEKRRRITAPFVETRIDSVA